MESDLNEMEVQLAQANRQASESQRIIRQLQTQVTHLFQDKQQEVCEEWKKVFRCSLCVSG